MLSYFDSKGNVSIIDKIKLNIGAKASIENKELLKTEIKIAIEKVFKSVKITPYK